MTLRFAAARTPASSPIARVLARHAHRPAVNDNGLAQGADDLLLHAALRHFAEHGLGAARAARKQAKQAFFAGDRQSYAWWLGICRTLDRRLAEEFEQPNTPALDDLPHTTG